MEPDKKTRLEDVISYTPEAQFSEDDLALIRAHFNGPAGAQLFRLIWKAMLPSVNDPELPMEQLGKDAFLGLIDFKSVPQDEAKSLAMGLQYTVKGIAGALINLKHIANVKEETPAERAARLKSNSAR